MLRPVGLSLVLPQLRRWTLSSDSEIHQSGPSGLCRRMREAASWLLAKDETFPVALSWARSVRRVVPSGYFPWPVTKTQLAWGWRKLGC